MKLLSRALFAIVASGCLALVTSGVSMATPPPCDKLTGGQALSLTLSSNSYTYTQGVTGSFQPTLTAAPNESQESNAACQGADPNQTDYWGAGQDLVTSLDFCASVTSACSESTGTDTDSPEDCTTITGAAFNEIAGDFSFSPSNGESINAAGPSQSFNVTFTNDANLAPGNYDVTLDVAPCASGESGNPFGQVTMELQVQAPTTSCTDLTDPNVTITQPSGTSFQLNSTIPVSFNAVDPVSQNCSLSGVDDVSATITACNGNYTLYSSLPLTTDPTSLPVAEGITVTASDSSVLLNQIGSFTLTAEATAPGTGTTPENTGMATTTFTVGAIVTPLPPVSLTGRQFKAGSTVPVIWELTDGSGNLLPLYDSIEATIEDPSGATNIVTLSPVNSPESGINYALDTTGTVVAQYHTNIQDVAAGTYKVTISAGDVCGNEATQGSFTFSVRN